MFEAASGGRVPQVPVSLRGTACVLHMAVIRPSKSPTLNAISILAGNIYPAAIFGGLCEHNEF
jgi:hypothetical protein